jgi:hypothetical protein
MRITLSVTLCIAAAYLQGCSDTKKAAAPATSKGKGKSKGVVAKNEQDVEVDNGGIDVGEGKEREEVSQREDDGEIEEEEVPISPPAVPDYVVVPASDSSVDISLVSKQAHVAPMRKKLLMDRQAILNKLVTSRAKFDVIAILPSVLDNEKKLVALDKRIMPSEKVNELHKKRVTKVIEFLKHMMSRYQDELNEKLIGLEKIKRKNPRKSVESQAKAINSAEGEVLRIRTHLDMIKWIINQAEQHITNM